MTDSAVSNRRRPAVASMSGINTSSATPAVAMSKTLFQRPPSGGGLKIFSSLRLPEFTPGVAIEFCISMREPKVRAPTHSSRTLITLLVSLRNHCRWDNSNCHLGLRLKADVSSKAPDCSCWFFSAQYLPNEVPCFSQNLVVFTRKASRSPLYLWIAQQQRIPRLTY